MDFQKSKKARVEVDDHMKEKYPHVLNLYKDLPLGVQISLHEFEDLAIERLKVLRVLELVTMKGTSKNFNEWREQVTQEFNKEGLKRFYRLITATSKEDCEVRRVDHTSHFILRIVYCQSEEYRRWFISRELELFKLRWSYLSSLEKSAFIKINNLNYTPLDEESCRSLGEVSGGFIRPETGSYYCVNWIDVLDLMRHRKIFCERGRAYITSADLISVIGSIFRSNLSHNLVAMSHSLPIIQEDQRLKRLVNNLHRAYTGKNYVVNDNRHVSLQSLDELSKSSFPLCMRQLHSALKTTHHLRHFGRQQFSLFLKGIGLNLDDALTFWRTEFTKKIDSDQFEKKYAYNIRHNYGKEGKRANYTPYSCGKIIASGVGPGEHHGCPFKHYDISSLKQTFASLRISPTDMSRSEEILHYVNIGQFQLACAKYFEVIHGIPILTGVNHPNQYFEESLKLRGSGKSNTCGEKPYSKASASITQTINNGNKAPDSYLDDSTFDGVNLDEFNSVT